MYDETEPLEVPDTTCPSCVESLAATAIFIHLKKKAGDNNLRFAFSLPPALERHQEFLTNISKSPCSLNISAITYNVPLLWIGKCSSTEQDVLIIDFPPNPSPLSKYLYVNYDSKLQFIYLLQTYIMIKTTSNYNYPTSINRKAKIYFHPQTTTCINIPYLLLISTIIAQITYHLRYYNFI